MTIPDMFRTCSCASSARRRSIRPALLLAATCLVPATALAQVTVNSATTGPIYGDGSSVTVTLSGTVTGNGDPGVVSTGTSVTTSVTNDGAILANGYLGYADGWAVWANGAAIGSITNNGLVDGEVRGVSIDNDGVSAVTTLTNNAGAVINGGLQMAIYNGNVLGTVVNSGTITGANGIYSLVTTGTIDNRAGGWLQGGKAIDVDGGTVGTITNAGTIYGGKGLFISASASVGTVDNGGSFLGLGDFAVFASGTIGTLTNSGTFAGTGGIASLVGIGSLSNQAGGRIEGTAVEGLYIGGTAGTITNAAGATIAGTTRGAVVATGATVTTVTNDGSVTGVFDWGFFAFGTVDTLTNSGTFAGTGGVASLTGIGSLSNQAGGRIEGTAVEGLFIGGTAGTVTNAAGATIIGATRGVTIDTGATVTTITNAGSVAGGSDWAVFNFGTVDTLTNSGTIAGMGGIASLTGLGSLSNQAGGRIEGASFGAVYVSGSAGTIANAAGATISGAGRGAIDVDAAGTLTTLSNAGVITNTAASNGWGVFNENVVSTLVNSGTIATAAVNGGGVVTFTQMDSLTNQAGGLIEGSNGTGVYVLVGTVTTLTNAGTISGSNYGVLTDSTSDATIDTLDNSGLITSSFRAVDNGHVIGTLVNSGRITGANSAITNSGSIGSIVNSGTVAFSGSGSGPAIHNLGTMSGGAGTQPAIQSTGSGALIAGTIVNEGVIFNGFTIANQDVEVVTGAGDGIFIGGTLAATDGNLALSAGGGGALVLQSDVSVNGGSGTFTNAALLGVIGTRQVTGDYQQVPIGTFISALDGTLPGEYGQFVISGSATFGGSLGLFEGVLSLAPGQTFELFDFASSSGGFSNLEVNFTPTTSLGGGVWSYGGLLLTEVWTGTSMSLSVTQSPSGVPEIDPTSCGHALAVALGALGLLERRARRLVRRARSG
jgi:hypothetical protein